MSYTGFPDVPMKVARARYNFATDGGAVSTIDLLPTPSIPAGSYIVGGFMEVDTIVAGSGASVAVNVESAGDLVAAAAVSGAPWSTTGIKAIVPVFTAATLVKTTAARKVTATVTAAVLTAGAFDVVLFYITLPD